MSNQINGSKSIYNQTKHRYFIQDRKVSFGFTLLECLISIALISILFGIAIPSFQGLLMREERALSLNNLETAIEFAKTEAFRSHETITLCMSIDQKNCIIGRGNSYLIFRNKEKSAQPKDNAVLRVGNLLSYGTLEFKCFGNSRSALDIEPDGFTYNNGHFCYCPRNQNSKEADGLILNNASRSYRPSNRDSLGILMIDKNTSLSCY